MVLYPRDGFVMDYTVFHGESIDSSTLGVFDGGSFAMLRSSNGVESHSMEALGL